MGAVTALFAATIGLRQWDIKKVLAYSTVSQLGYMFVGVGVGAYAAGVFHLVTHAFFKALLFLGAGSVILRHARAPITDTGTTRTRRTCATWAGCDATCRSPAATMWIATLAIAGVPPFAGFFSKDEILGTVFARAQARRSPMRAARDARDACAVPRSTASGCVAALLTAIYMTRMMLYTFHGPNRHW